jgi:hypothetical protein
MLADTEQRKPIERHPKQPISIMKTIIRQGEAVTWVEKLKVLSYLYDCREHHINTQNSTKESPAIGQKNTMKTIDITLSRLLSTVSIVLSLLCTINVVAAS